MNKKRKKKTNRGCHDVWNGAEEFRVKGLTENFFESTVTSTNTRYRESLSNAIKDEIIARLYESLTLKQPAPNSQEEEQVDDSLLPSPNQFRR